MITTLSGINSFGWLSRLRQLVNDYVAVNSDLGLERLDGESASTAAVRQAINSPPMLVTKKLVILREPSLINNFAEQFEQIFSDLPETTELVIVEPKLDKRLSYYKYLKTKTELEDYPELDQPAMAKWLIERAKAKAGQLSLGDANYLIERLGPRQQLLSNELDKLLLYDPNVNRQSIDLLTEATPQSTIFQLLEAAFNGRAEQSLKLYKEQRAMKVEPPQIVAMLAWQLHILCLVKAAKDRLANQLAVEAGISPFVISKSQSMAAKLSLGQLKRLNWQLLTIDIRSKTSAIDVDEALENYLLGLAF